MVISTATKFWQLVKCMRYLFNDDASFFRHDKLVYLIIHVSFYNFDSKLVGEEECRRHLIDLRLRDETRCTKCGVIHSGSCEEYWKKVEEEEEVQRSRERNMEFMEDTQDKNGDVDVVDFAVSPSMESKIFLRCVRCNFVVRGMDDSIKICKKVKGKPHRFRNFGALTLIVSN